MTVTVQAEPVTRTSLASFSAHHLLGLLKGEVFAVRIRDFLSPEELRGLSERFVGRSDHSPLATDHRFRRLGQAFSENSDDEARENYFATALDAIGEVRAIAAPYRHPADTLRLVLDEVWPTGATLLRRASSPFFAGVVRYQQGAVDLEPHTDNVARNLPPNNDFRILRQLSVNVYLDVPDLGGELEIWDDYPDEGDYTRRAGARVWGLDRESVGPPDLVLRPTPGEAIVIDPRRVHAVRPSADRPRVTVGLFIGVRDDDAPLAIWS